LSGKTSRPEPIDEIVEKEDERTQEDVERHAEATLRAMLTTTAKKAATEVFC
jgi:hypothetical protein